MYLVPQTFFDILEIEGHDESISLVGMFLQCTRNYYAEIGKIASMCFWSKSRDYIDGIVQFEQTKHAQKALESPSHNVLLGRFPLRVLDPICLIRPQSVHAYGRLYMDGQFAESENDLPTSKDGLNILDIDDDCIQEIFDYLDVMDLCSVAEVCERFRANAQRQFAVHHKSLHFLEVATLNKHRMASFIENFGQFAKKLNVSRHHLPRPITMCFTNMLLWHFTSLEEVTLHRFTLDEKFAELLFPLFVRLKKLCLYECRISNAFSNVLANCSELTKIKVIESYVEKSVWQPMCLPKLESFTVIESVSSQSEYLPEFLTGNSQLRKIGLELPGTINVNKVVATFAHLVHIEKLVLSLCRDTNVERSLNAWSHLIPLVTRMRRLTKLKIFGYKFLPSKSIAQLFNAMAAAKVPVEHLELRRGGLDALIVDAICNLKSLKTLSLSTHTERPDERYFLQLCGSLRKLTDLHVETGSYRWRKNVLPSLLQMGQKLQRIRLHFVETPITADIYLQLLEIARERATTKPLQILINPKSMEDLKKSVSQAAINANVDILAVSCPF